MSAPAAIHLCIVQPAGYVHSLGFLDQARYFRWQFRRLGAQVSIGKNRLRRGAINFVFGAHLGFDAAQCKRHSCIFVNLEQLGQGGAQVSADYLALLKSSAVVDYDADNVPSYASDPADVPLVPFLHAPYLAPAQPLALEDRPIDLLFFGSMNPRRKAWLDRIEAMGHTVSHFESPLYGPERDHYIAQAKAVVNVHFYESSRFEQARVSHCLSLGTPVISERTAQTRPHPAFEDAVLWLQDFSELEQYFGHDHGTPACFDALRAGLARFAESDPIEAYADLLAFATGYAGEHLKHRDNAAWRPTQVKLGSAADYQPGWLNIDTDATALPDLRLDWSQRQAWPLTLESPTQGTVQLDAGSVSTIVAVDLLHKVPDVAAVLDNALRLLRDGGELQLEVPAAQSPTAWQDPATTRAMNERSWLACTEQFWTLGWFEHRFEVASSSWLDASRRPCDARSAAAMRLVLRKVETSPRERTLARTLGADFGALADDLPPERDALRVLDEPLAFAAVATDGPPPQARRAA